MVYDVCEELPTELLQTISNTAPGTGLSSRYLMVLTLSKHKVPYSFLRHILFGLSIKAISEYCETIFRFAFVPPGWLSMSKINVTGAIC